MQGIADVYNPFNASPVRLHNNNFGSHGNAPRGYDRRASSHSECRWTSKDVTT